MFRIGGRQLQLLPDWRATVLALLLMPLLLSLGFWQLERAEEKRQFQLLFQQRQASGPVLIEKLDPDSDIRYQPVSLRGEFINDKALLLDNKIYKGRFGYEIIMPFRLASSAQLVLINRGWLAADISRRQLPDIPVIHGMVDLVGEVYVPQGKMLELAKDMAEGWPRVVQSINIDELGKQFDMPVFPYTVRLQQQSTASFINNWLVVNIQPEKHTGYAVQWFSMCVVLLVILFLANTNFWILIKARDPGDS